MSKVSPNKSSPNPSASRKAIETSLPRTTGRRGCRVPIRQQAERRVRKSPASRRLRRLGTRWTSMRKPNVSIRWSFNGASFAGFRPKDYRAGLNSPFAAALSAWRTPAVGPGSLGELARSCAAVGCRWILRSRQQRLRVPAWLCVSKTGARKPLAMRMQKG